MYNTNNTEHFSYESKHCKVFTVPLNYNFIFTHVDMRCTAIKL